MAYAAVQVRPFFHLPHFIIVLFTQAQFMLCPIEHWTQYDGNYNHEALFNNIVKLFESALDHPWVVEMLAWWDKYVRFFVHDNF
jgi:hypothetical protein